MDYYAIGQRIRKTRKAHGLSQEQLAELIGISTTHMSHIETGNTKLSLPVLVSLAEALEVRTDELLFAEPPRRTGNRAGGDRPPPCHLHHPAAQNRRGCFDHYRCRTEKVSVIIGRYKEFSKGLAFLRETVL